MDDMVFCRYCTVTSVNTDGTVDCREDEGTVHLAVPNLTNMVLSVDDSVLVGFVENNVYNPVVLGMLEAESSYTRSEIDKIVEDIISGDVDLKDYVRKTELLEDYDVDLDISCRVGEEAMTVDFSIVEGTVSKSIDILGRS